MLVQVNHAPFSVLDRIPTWRVPSASHRTHHGADQELTGPCRVVPASAGGTDSSQLSTFKIFCFYDFFILSHDDVFRCRLKKNSCLEFVEFIQSGFVSFICSRTFIAIIALDTVSACFFFLSF